MKKNIKKAFTAIGKYFYYLKQKALYNKALGDAYKYAYKGDKLKAYKKIEHIRKQIDPKAINQKEINQIEKFLLTH